MTTTTVKDSLFVYHGDYFADANDIWHIKDEAGDADGDAVEMFCGIMLEEGEERVPSDDVLGHATCDACTFQVR